MPNIGPMELIVVLVIALVVLGPKRLPGLGKQLGTGMRDFKEAISGNDRDDDDHERPALTPAQKAEAVVDPADKPAAAPADEPATKTGA
jgi:sec-independent protein translocase protein TatA